MKENEYKAKIEEIERKLKISEKINTALMNRVEHNMNASDGSFALFQSAITLENKIKERTEQLDAALNKLKISNQELVTEKTRAEHANKTKSDFLANMSHEIRTPLTAIIGFSELLESNDLSDEDKYKYLHTIKRSGKHLLNMINDILDLSKIEAGKLDIEIMETSVVDMVKEVISLHGMHAAEKGISLDVDYTFPFPEYIQTDPVRVRQIIINLLGNAIKFTSDGGVKLSICFLKNNLIFSVKDTGIGISKEAQEKLFRPFSQADISTTRKFGGTGLGLHLSNQLAHKLGGEINCKSEQDKGSEFSFVLKLKEKDFKQMLESMPEERPKHPAINKTDVSQREGNVLIVDDNNDNQVLIAHFVNKLGANISYASNGLEAVEQARENKFDVILMDMQMPIMDGMEATRILRDEGYKRPIVALTANAMKKDIEQCTAAGCDNFLAKPIDQDMFYRIVSGYLHTDKHSSALTDKPVNKEEKSKAGDKAITADCTDGGAIYSELLKDGKESFCKLVDKFIDRVPQYMSEIRQAANSKDSDEIKQIFHNIKGVSGNYGYPQLYEVCKKAEELSEKNNTKEFYQCVEDASIICERILMVRNDVKKAEGC